VELTSLLAVVASAFLVTLATVIVPSPSTMAASRYAVSHGTRAAAACLSGVVVLDILVFLSLAYGFEPVLYRIGGHRYLLPAAAMLLLIAGLGMILLAPRDVSTRLISARGKERADREQALHGPFLAGLLIPIANPGYWIWWTTVGTSFIHAARRWGNLGLTLLLTGFIAGVVVWYIPLLYALHHGRQIFSKEAQQRILVALGVGMVAFGAHLLWTWLRS
jgi:threonine/homoserine/homoserine lactone efflux protein